MRCSILQAYSQDPHISAFLGVVLRIRRSSSGLSIHRSGATVSQHEPPEQSSVGGARFRRRVRLGFVLGGGIWLNRSPMNMRRANIRRMTNETRIVLALNLDGSGKSAIRTGIPFFDHM